MTLPEHGAVPLEWKFDVGYGIILTARIGITTEHHPGTDYLSYSFDWTQAGLRGYMGSSGRAQEVKLPNPMIGRAKCEVWDDGSDRIRVSVGVGTDTQDWIGDGRGVYLDKYPSN